MREFATGATRDTDDGKYDYEAFLSPWVVERYGAYMHANRKQANGQLRDGDNWQKGIPPEVYMKSAFRHFVTVWKEHRQGKVAEDEVCAVLFNMMGYLHGHLTK